MNPGGTDVFRRKRIEERQRHCYSSGTQKSSAVKVHVNVSGGWKLEK
jgi:hypothetical protein